MVEELLKKLLEAELLTPESKAELEAAFKLQIAEAVSKAEATAAERVKDELKQQWVTERDALVEAVDAKITEYLAEEIEELQGEFAAFRDLEAEYAAREVEHRAQLAEQLQKDLAELTNLLDSFLEERFAAEFGELKQELAEARQAELGRRMFESFVNVYRDCFVEEGTIEAQVKQLQQELTVVRGNLEEAQQSVEAAKRAAKMEQVLRPLTGKARDIMENILRTVKTQELDEGYQTFIGRVMRQVSLEESTGSQEKEKSVLAEGSKVSTKIKEGSFVVKSGDGAAVSPEPTEGKSPVVESLKSQLRLLAGITQ